MCQMSMKLPAMFGQNPPSPFDKIVITLITTKKRSQSLTLSKSVKVIAEIKSMPPKKFEQGFP